MQLYIHIPFCVRKCRYCDFTSFAGQTDRMEGYIDCLLREAALTASECTSPMKTVYLGGGTPSLLPAPLLRRLMNGLRAVFPFEADMECTAEANPGTVQEAWLEAALECGFNRLSIGMQAAQPALLRTLERIHDANAVRQTVIMARTAGFSNLSLDLIFGIPGQTLADWMETLERALELSPEHLSAYGLIPEEGTPLQTDLDAGRLCLPDVELEREMYDTAILMLREAGLCQYEISNFAKPGRECQHNIGYWTQKPYLGLGLSAASMIPQPIPGETGFPCVRRTNPRTFGAYEAFLSDPDQNAALREITYISPESSRFETLMLGLRLNDGVSAEAFQALHGVSLDACYGKKLESLAENGLVLHDNGRWRLTRRGQDIQNAVLVELMD